MFSQIKRVDIEFHSHCNRTCAWCPNKTLDRKSQDIEMQDDMYSKILDELINNNFGAGFNKMSFSNPIDRRDSETLFCFLGNQEPFTSPILFKRRVREAYEKLPTHVKLIANSNGDFLSIENLDELYLTNLEIMDYDCKGKEYWENKLNESGVLVVDYDKEMQILTGVHRHVGSVRVRLNWPQTWQLEDKGGFFKQGDLPDMHWTNNMDKRTIVCYESAINLTIAYDGSIMPCCHMRPDNINHKDFIMGNLNNNSLVEIYSSKKFIDFKKNLLDEINAFPSPCRYCQKSRPENYYSNPLRENLLKKML